MWPSRPGRTRSTGRGPGTGEIVGVDRGVALTAALSTGEMLRCPGLSVRERARLRKAQRRAARAVRKSPAQEAEWARVGRLRVREADRRKDFVEKASTRLARGYDLIRFEKLNIVTMTRSAAGTVDEPGSGRATESGVEPVDPGPGLGDAAGPDRGQGAGPRPGCSGAVHESAV
jgi:putative transposase